MKERFESFNSDILTGCFYQYEQERDALVARKQRIHSGAHDDMSEEVLAKLIRSKMDIMIEIGGVLGRRNRGY